MSRAIHRQSVLGALVAVIACGHASLDARQQDASKTIRIDMTSAKSVAPDVVKVPSGTPVTVTVLKNPFQTCTVDTKNEVMKPEPGALASLLGIAFTLLGGAPEPCAREVEPATAEATRIDAQLQHVNVDISTTVSRLQTTRDEYAALAGKVRTLVRCEQPGVCESRQNAEGAARKLAKDIRSKLDSPPTVPATTAAEIEALTKAIAGVYAQGPPASRAEAAFLADAAKRLACVQQKADVAAESRKVLSAAHDALVELQKQLEDLVGDTSMTADLHPGRNLTTTATVSCVNAVTKQPVVYVEAAGGGASREARVVSPVVVTVQFEDRPRAAVAAGLLVSSLGKRQLATQPVKTGVDASGAATFTTKIRETETSDTQLLPFFFFNYALARSDAASFNLAAGIGLNPNNGSTQVEYVLGTAVGIRKFYAEIGCHFGHREELINGFQIDDVAPAGFAGVPFDRRWTARFAVALTYRIPLPK